MTSPADALLFERRRATVAASCAPQSGRALHGFRHGIRIARAQDMSSKIEDYGLIGNMQTAALVSRQGSIDWLCAPRFDSDACFAALLGYDEHGRWALRPTVSIRETRQRYRDDTMILESEFACDGGVVRIIDFMPMGDRCEVVRIVEGGE